MIIGTIMAVFMLVVARHYNMFYSLCDNFCIFGRTNLSLYIYLKSLKKRMCKWQWQQYFKANMSTKAQSLAMKDNISDTQIT